MLRRASLGMLLLCWGGAAFSGTVVAAPGRSIEVPAQIACMLPASPPAPDLTKLPQVARLTGREDMTRGIAALKSDLIPDNGTIAPRNIEMAKATQQRTGIPTVPLDGAGVHSLQP